MTAGVVSNAVNQPAVPDEGAGIHVQYVLLARRLSQFLIHARQRPARTLEVTLAGASAELPKSTLAHAALAELLAPMLDAPVNAVNAAVLAAERGVEVSEATSAVCEGRACSKKMSAKLQVAIGTAHARAGNSTEAEKAFKVRVRAAVRPVRF